MILRRLELRRFLGLADHAFEFAPGLNVVVGPNEAGKSTLRMAIRTVLYENPATASSRYREQFRSWQVDDPPELRLHFELAGRPFTLTKNYAARKVILTDAVTGQTWEQHKAVQERLVAALGLPTDDLFDATAHIAQAHLERIHVTSIGKELGTVIGGGGEDVAAALRRLDAHIRALERGSRGAAVKEPGRLMALDRRAAALRTEVETLRRNAAEAERARTELAALTAANVRMAEELAAKKRLLESNRETLQLEQRLAGLKSNERHWEHKIRQIEEYTGKLLELDRALEAATASGVPGDERVAEGRALQERLGARQRDLAALTADAPPPQIALTAVRRSIVLAAAGLLLAAVGAGLLRFEAAAGWTAILLGAAAAGIGALRWSGLARVRQVTLMRQEERERRRTMLDAEIADLRAALEQVLAALGCASLQEAQTRVERYRELAQERRRLTEFLGSLREGGTDEAIVDQWNTIRRDIFGVEERLRDPEVAARRLTPLQVQTLDREVAELAQVVAEKQRREIKLTVDLERLTPEAEDLVVKEEQLNDVEEQLERVRRHLAVCKVALEALGEARRQAEIPIREVAERRAGEYLRVATGGRYTRVRVEGEDLDLSVWSDEAGTWVAAQEPGVSRGTVDLIYLAVRLALVEVLTHGKRPPLLFDDPFITFDRRRREGALGLLRELGKTYQIILFTCNPDYAREADRVIAIADRTVPQAASFGGPATSAPEAAQPVPAVGPLWERIENTDR